MFLLETHLDMLCLCGAIIATETQMQVVSNGSADDDAQKCNSLSKGESLK